MGCGRQIIVCCSSLIIGLALHQDTYGILCSKALSPDLKSPAHIDINRYSYVTSGIIELYKNFQHKI